MQPSPEQAHFWRWFLDNGPRLRAAMYGPDPDAREAAGEELREAVQAAEPGLILEFAQQIEGQPDQIVVSADGKPEYVDTVKDFVASAPPLPGWQLIAFRPRMEVGDSIVIDVQGERVEADDVWFRTAETTDGLDLTLHVRGLTPGNEKLRRLGASLLAEHTMGEYDSLTLLDSRAVEPLPADPAAAGLRPLGELLAVIDEVRERKFPPPGGLRLDPEGNWNLLRGTVGESAAMMLLNAGLLPYAGHPGYDRRLVVSLPFHESDENGMPATEEEFAVVCDLGEQIGAALETDQESLLALAITTQGRRDLIFYTSDAGAALERLAPWRTGAQEYELAVDVERDTFWAAYRSFCDAGDEDDEEE
jgi:hypothetical protein